MPLERISYPDRKHWLAGRERQGIGASEVAAIVGLSPWMKASELWEIKRGIRRPKDISSDEAVQRGVNLEGWVRDSFRVLHPEYQIEYHPYDVLFQTERPRFFATLDGELTDADGRKGILEIKTASPSSREQWAQWNGKVPGHYQIQVMAQLLATGYDFAVLQAALWSRSGDITLKDPYIFERPDFLQDLIWLRKEQDEFWHKVETGTNPGATIRF